MGHDSPISRGYWLPCLDLRQRTSPQHARSVLKKLLSGISLEKFSRGIRVFERIETSLHAKQPAML